MAMPFSATPKRSWTWPRWPICPPSRPAWASSTSSTGSVPPTKSRSCAPGPREDLKDMVDWDAIRRFHDQANLPSHPYHRGSNESPETFFQHREASNTAYTTAWWRRWWRTWKRSTSASAPTINPSTTTAPPTPPTWWWPWAPSAAPWKRWWTSSWPRGERWGFGGSPLPALLLPPPAGGAPDTLQRLAVLDRTKEPGAFGEPSTWM